MPHPRFIRDMSDVERLGLEAIHRGIDFVRYWSVPSELTFADTLSQPTFYSEDDQAKSSSILLSATERAKEELIESFPLLKTKLDDDPDYLMRCVLPIYVVDDEGGLISPGASCAGGEPVRQHVFVFVGKAFPEYLDALDSFGRRMVSSQSYSSGVFSL